MKKLNTRGFSHDIMLVLFVVIFAVVGVGYLVASHAAVGWTSWSTIGGGTVVGGPASASWAPGRLDVFARAANGNLLHKSYCTSSSVYGCSTTPANQWSAWQNLGGDITGDPTATSMGPGRLDVFARGTNGAVWHIDYAGSWGTWTSLGGTIIGSPAIAGGHGNMFLFAEGANKALWWRGCLSVSQCTGSNWSNWASLGGSLTSSPAAVSWGPNRLDVFARGTNGALWHIDFNGSWQSWQSLGGTLASGPAAASWASGRLDVFYISPSNNLQHLYFDGAWEPATSEDLGNGALQKQKPTAVSWGPNRIDVFATEKSGLVGHIAWSSPVVPTTTTPTPPPPTTTTTTAPPPPPVVPPPEGQTGNWNSVFYDDFSSDTSLNLTKWTLCNPAFKSSCVPYNDEQELYNTTLPSNPNVNISNGALNLVATEQNGQIYSGMVTTGPDEFGTQPNYTGFEYDQGYIQVVAKMPKGDGFWPAIWIDSGQNTRNTPTWPASGEYDIAEVAGNTPTVVHMTEHDGNTGGYGDSASATVSDTSAGYHTYGFAWDSNHLAWYIDGVQARSMICTAAYATANPTARCDGYDSPAAFKNTPFYIVMNLAVGGNWSSLDGGPDSTTTYPATMSIKSVGVWQPTP